MHAELQALVRSGWHQPLDQVLVEGLTAAPAGGGVAEADEVLSRLQRTTGEHPAGAARVFRADRAAERAVLQGVVESDAAQEQQLVFDAVERCRQRGAA